MNITKKHTIATGIAALLLILGVFVSPSHAWPPCIDVWKWVEPEVSKVGDEVVYTICVKNCGEIHLRNVVVEDPLLGGVLDFPDMVDDMVKVGETFCKEFTYTIKPDDPDPLVNVVTATGWCRYGNKATDTDTATVDLVVVGIDISKAVDNTNPCFGETVTYTICIENTGEWPLEHVLVEDSLLGGILSGFPDALEVGQVACSSFEYEVNSSDTCPLVNTAKVRSDPSGPMTNCIEDEDSVEICPQLCDGEGLTPGYWKNHPDSWEGYDPDATFSEVFGVDINVGSGKKEAEDPTLMEALNGNGGGATALARAATAAILNASNPDIAYPLSVQEIQDTVAAALNSDDPDIIEATKDILDELNNLGYSQDAHCRPQDEEKDKGKPEPESKP